MTNLLVTGAAGYIGGSIVADFVTKNLVQKKHIYAAVRSEEQASALSTLNVNVLKLDLGDEDDVTKAVLDNNIDIVIHTASAIDPTVTLPLVKALGKRKRATGKDIYYIHTSALSAFCEGTGWPADVGTDFGPVFQTEKALAESFPVRGTDVAVIDLAKDEGVTSFIVIPSTVHGRGTGPYNQLSVLFPVYIKATLEQRTLYQFDENVGLKNVHISDLTALYELIVQKILQKEKIPTGEEGYYFGIAHEGSWYEAQALLADALLSRGLIDSPEIKLWPSDEFAAESLGVPAVFLRTLWNSVSKVKTSRAQSIGWKPRWDQARFAKEIGNEIDDVIELGRAKSSLINSLHEAAKNHQKDE